MVAAFAPGAVKTAELELAAAQLAIDASQVRVALSRLRRQGKVEPESRGLYRLSSRVQLQQTAFGRWWERLDKIEAKWSGRFYVALTSWLPKSDRRAARSRNRALTRLGFREFRPGFALRPANLSIRRDDMEDLLQRLGFDEDGELLVASSLRFDPKHHWSDLPDYAGRARALREGLTALKKDGTVEAAMTAFTVANDMIREAVRDPLLPHEWVDSKARASFWRALVDYDAYGRTLWKKNVWDRSAAHSRGSKRAEKKTAKSG
jgi:phenylacetic acid degradation operon negative regulatory protein